MSEARKTPNIISLAGPELRRLGRNLHGYRGETIDIASVLADCVAAARTHGWHCEEIPVDSQSSMFAFTRSRSSPERSREPEVQRANDTQNGTASAVPRDERAGIPRVYISSGIHGDEPAGPLTIRRLLQENLWPEALDVWLCPCLNPAGFILNRRENPQGLDLNRGYRHPTAPETLAHVAWLERQPAFDLSICVHEDWESSGFYVYELNPDGRPSFAEEIVFGAARVCPIDGSNMIEGRPAKGGIIRPNLDPRSRPDWPEAFFLITHKSRLSYTLEAPSDFPMPVRVAALTEGVRAAVQQLARSHCRAASER